MIRLFLMALVILQQVYGNDIATEIVDEFNDITPDGLEKLLSSGETNDVQDGARRVRHTSIRFLKETNIFIDPDDYHTYKNWCITTAKSIEAAKEKNPSTTNHMLLIDVKESHMKICKFVKDYQVFNRESSENRDMERTFKKEVETILFGPKIKEYYGMEPDHDKDNELKIIRSQLMIQDLFSQFIRHQTSTESELLYDFHKLNQVNRKWGFPFDERLQQSPDSTNPKSIIMYMGYYEHLSYTLRHIDKPKDGSDWKLIYKEMQKKIQKEIHSPPEDKTTPKLDEVFDKCKSELGELRKSKTKTKRESKAKRKAEDEGEISDTERPKKFKKL